MKVIIVTGGPISDQFLKRWTKLHQSDHPKKWLFVGVDRGSLTILKAGLPLDCAIGDFDSMSLEEKQWAVEKAKFVEEFPSKKDDTDFEKALLWVKEHYPSHQIHVLTNFSGRVDHLLSCFWTVFRPDLKSLIPYLQFEDETNHVTFLLPGEYRIEKLPQMRYISVITWQVVRKLTLKNVAYPLHAADYDYPVALVSNEFLEKTMTLSFEEGIMMIVQTRDRF